MDLRGSSAFRCRLSPFGSLPTTRAAATDFSKSVAPGVGSNHYH